MDMKHESTCGSIAWSRAQSGRCREAAFNVWEQGGARRLYGLVALGSAGLPLFYAWLRRQIEELGK